MVGSQNTIAIRLRFLMNFRSAVCGRLNRVRNIAGVNDMCSQVLCSVEETVYFDLVLVELLLKPDSVDGPYNLA